MEITILGTKGEVEETVPYHTKHSGVLINKKLLLDLGEEEFLQYKPEYIFLTHLHPDHAFFVRRGVEFTGDIKAPLWGPENYSNKSRTLQRGIKPRCKDLFDSHSSPPQGAGYSGKVRDKVKVRRFSGQKRIGDFKITTIPVIHSTKVKSQAYLIEANTKRLLYTGDVAWIKKEHHHLFGALDLVITEASFIRKGGLIRRLQQTGQIYGHTGVPDLIRIFSDYTNKIVFMHFGAWFFKQGATQAQRKIKHLGKERGIQTIMAYDGLQLEI